MGYLQIYLYLLDKPTYQFMSGSPLFSLTSAEHVKHFHSMQINDMSQYKSQGPGQVYMHCFRTMNGLQ